MSANLAPPPARFGVVAALALLTGVGACLLLPVLLPWPLLVLLLVGGVLHWWRATRLAWLGP